MLHQSPSRLAGWLSLALLVLVAGCGGTLTDECLPGETTRCACDDGLTGALVCRTDGTGWDDCDCGGTGGDGDGDTDTDVDGDTDTDTDSDADRCVTDCGGRECGPDGCGGSCFPGCSGDEECNPSTGSCVSCMPSCTGRSCGSDGCGGFCAPGCSSGERCIELSGQCCASNCTDRQCGSDGCGGTCPPGCAPGDVCDEATGLCGACVPDCTMRQCGSDGCSGTCGPGCSPGDECDETSGLCGTCDILTGTGCPEGMKCGLVLPAAGGIDAACVPVAALPVFPGGGCTFTEDATIGSYDDCEGGSVCYPDRVRGNLCMVMCTEMDASPCTNAYGLATGGYVDGLCSLTLGEPLTGMRVCLPDSLCDPLCQNCPGFSDVCYPTRDRANNVGTLCFPYQAPGVPGCTFLNNCPAGTFCASTTSGGQCIAMCDPTSTSACTHAGCTTGSCGIPTDGAGDPVYPADMFSVAEGIGLCM